MKVTILGCYAATPRTLANPTSQLLEIQNRFFLIDCGEGTQVQLRKNKIKFSKINHVFISHLHGDHFYGLIGLISSFSLLSRVTDLHIYGPKGLKDIILLQLKLTQSWTQFQLVFHELNASESVLIFEDEKVAVYTIPLQHRIYTNGFLFVQKEGEKKLNISAIQEYAIDVCYYKKIKKGGDIRLEDDSIVSNGLLTFPGAPEKRYAFCSDTAYSEEIIPLIHNVDLLYHESTFLEHELKLAEKTMHSTAIQAATIASKANAKQLLLGHYSTRYDDIQSFKEEAQTVFQNVLLAKDGQAFEI